MSNNYSNDRQQNADIEFASDPASGGIFSSDFKRHEDLKQMLDTNKDSLKLEAMKRIIGMVAKGKDASDLFPAVVKNVVSSNLEVKKLVYVYLVRYAEEQQDLALLSISTFQRGLKDPNPLIRACALRVLSSVRVPVIVPIMLLAIKETVTDLSPYVRKTTAHAIPKLYNLDPEQKDELMTVIGKLLSDMSTLVVGSAVMAFEEVCPERIDLIHTNYRKLCCLLIDVEEWGQIIIINMLTRYARTQFADPNKGDLFPEEEEKDRPFYEDETEEEESSEETKEKSSLVQMDRDHRLLLTITKPLLQSRNAAVVLAVAQLYQHSAPKAEVAQVARSLVRLLRCHREIQVVILTNIASLSTQRKGMFEPFLKSFFIRSSDPTQIKILKLEVMTNIATETNIALILREFQTYIWSADKDFVAATIQAIGRCASNIKDVTDSCLNGLVTLLSNKNELVVGESVVVVRKLLQNETIGHKDIITHMARLVDNIKMPTARASILWLLGEYCDKVPKIAPDVLRKMAKSFINEADIVKLQIITLATKLYLTNPKQTHLLCVYVFNLAKYDTNYDIRDRARFIRALIFPPEAQESVKLATQARNIFLASKPPPVQQSNFKDRDQYQLGTLSHAINARAAGYSDLPPFPEEVPDPSVRNRKESGEDNKEDEQWMIKTKKGKKKKEKLFYSADEDSEDSESDSSSGGTSSSDGDSNDSSSSLESSDNSNTSSSPPKDNKVVKKMNNMKIFDSSSPGSSESESSDSDDSISSSEGEKQKRRPMTKKKSTPPRSKKANSEAPNMPTSKSNLDLLLDLDCGDTSIETPVMTPSLGGLLSPLAAPNSSDLSATFVPGASIKSANPRYVSTKTDEILNRISGRGLSIDMRFTRSPHLYSPKMTSIELTFKNNSSEPRRDIGVGTKRLSSEMSLHEFAVISNLAEGASVLGTIGIDFNDSIQPANFDIVATGQSYGITVTPTIGELIRPVSMTEADFNHHQVKLKGMNEYSGSIETDSKFSNRQIMTDKIYEGLNIIQVPSTEENVIKFSGQTASAKSLVLLSLTETESNKFKVTINSEKMIVTSMIFKHLQLALKS